jgi:hypothetical protein
MVFRQSTCIHTEQAVADGCHAAVLRLWGWAGGQQLFTTVATSYEKLQWLQQGPQKEKTTCLTTVGNTKKFHRKSRCSTTFTQFTTPITMYTGVWSQALTSASSHRLTPASYHHIHPNIRQFFFLVIIWRMGDDHLRITQKTKRCPWKVFSWKLKITKGSRRVTGYMRKNGLQDPLNINLPLNTLWTGDADLRF